MEAPGKRVLFVNSEIYPYLPETPMSLIGRYLPQGILDHKKEIRSFMPRYGCINERKNQLHEVIRLSGMNIVVRDVDRPFVIKVASISAARMQVYFIDNEDYFRRRELFRAEDGTFFADNAERVVFFARSVLETVKKSRWAPDIIHCHGWISHLLPLYLKKTYKDDPIFTGCKVVTSFYDDTPQEGFSADFATIARAPGVSAADLAPLRDASGTALAKMAAQFSDGVIFSAADVPADLAPWCAECGIPVMPFDAEALQNGSYVDAYNRFYDQLL